MLEQLSVLLASKPYWVCRLRSGPKQLPHNKSIWVPRFNRSHSHSHIKSQFRLLQSGKELDASVWLERAPLADNFQLKYANYRQLVASIWFASAENGTAQKREKLRKIYGSAHNKQVKLKWAQNMKAHLHFKYLIAGYFPLVQFA